MSFEAAFKSINAFLCDVIEHSPPEMKEFLERQRFSEWKLRKMVERLGGEKLEHHHQSGPFEAFGVDGKEGPVRLKMNKFVKQDKQTVTDQVSGKLVDFFIPQNHSAVAISANLYEILEKYGSVDTILSLSVDNEKKNTGRNNGCIRLLEEQLNRALQWICCLLHLIEVVFRHIYETIDGKAVGPQSYRGKIGQIVSNKDEEWKTDNPPLNFYFEIEGEGLFSKTGGKSLITICRYYIFSADLSLQTSQAPKP